MLNFNRSVAALAVAVLAGMAMQPSVASANGHTDQRDHAAGSTLVDRDPGALGPEVSESSSAAPWLRGMDLSYWQGEAAGIGWGTALERGSAFAYVKVSEGSYGGIATRYAAQRETAQSHGLFTGSYHFANPNKAYSSGAGQARLFAEYSGRWNAPVDELRAPGQKLLPPMLDLEWNPYPEDGDACYDLSTTEMVAWIHEFLETATDLFGREPVIYTSTSWWSLCTGDSTEFGDYPLSIARWTADKAGGPGALPAGWDSWTFWQHGNADLDYTPKEDLLPGDQQHFAGTSRDDLKEFADLAPR